MVILFEYPLFLLASRLLLAQLQQFMIIVLIIILQILWKLLLGSSILLELKACLQSLLFLLSSFIIFILQPLIF
jgi:hypothetical protein